MTKKPSKSTKLPSVYDEQPVDSVPSWALSVLQFTEMEIELRANAAIRLHKAKPAEHHSAALRWIDEHIKLGNLEKAKQDLLVKYSAELEAQKDLDQYYEIKFSRQRGKHSTKTLRQLSDSLSNLRSGLNAPDATERSKYQLAHDCFVALYYHPKSVEIIPHLIPILDLIPFSRSKSEAHRGRPGTNGWPSNDDYHALLEMRVLIGNGASIALAAKTVGRTLAGASALATQKRLERYWKWKMNLRDRT